MLFEGSGALQRPLSFPFWVPLVLTRLSEDAVMLDGELLGSKAVAVAIRPQVLRPVSPLLLLVQAILAA
jgi:hypothetical protein